MNSKLKLYMRKKNTEQFFKECGFKYLFIERLPSSDFYKKIFSRVNVIDDFHDMGAAIEALVCQFTEISKKVSHDTWVLLFSNKDVDISVAIELDANGERLRKIIELSMTYNGFLDDFIMLSESDEAICISRDEYSYSVCRDTSRFDREVYLSLMDSVLS
ncbi:MAG: YxiF family protein [Plesiomonas shigelloides]